MIASKQAGGHEQIVVEVNRTQLEYFINSDRRCRGVQLPEGIMLRYNLSKSLYFYLRTAVEDGKIVTRVFASDNPYERQKSAIGEVATPMFDRETHQFDPDADQKHLERVEALLNAWVEFVKDANDGAPHFTSFPVAPRTASRIV